MTDTILLIVISIVVLCSHVVSALPFVRKVVRQELPSGVDFCCVALLLYYDVGLLYELAAYTLAAPLYAQFAHGADCPG